MNAIHTLVSRSPRAGAAPWAVRRARVLPLLLAMSLWGCNWPWPLDRSDDPGRCAPACGAGVLCRDGRCVPPDGAAGSDGTSLSDAADGPDAALASDASADGDGPSLPDGPGRDAAGTDARLETGPIADRSVPSERGTGPEGGPPGDLRARDAPPADLLLPDRRAPAPDQRSPDATRPDLRSPDLFNICNTLTCTLGCFQQAGRCYRLKPSNFDPSAFAAHATASVVAAGSIVFNTDDGSITQGAVQVRPPNTASHAGVYWTAVAQTGAPGLSVFSAASLTIPSGISAVVRGTRAFAFYAFGNITIAGTLSALPAASSPGAGGYAGGANNYSGAVCPGSGEGKPGTSLAGGWRPAGAGGGRNAVGGPSGSQSNLVAAGAGGKANGLDTLIPLYGGCGGAGGYTDKYCTGGAGGGGGGAVQLSADGALLVSGTIHVPGAGGRGSPAYSGGGGGGSGGAVLLEGHSVTVSGLVAANGGGGGAADRANPGADGQASTVAALGGQAYSGSKRGGSGGALATVAGGSGAMVGAHATGGGGAAGRIRVNGRSVSVAAGKASPAPSLSLQINGTW